MLAILWLTKRKLIPAILYLGAILIFYIQDFISGITSNDLFTINSKKISLKFILAEQMSYFPAIPPGSIGLGVSPSSANMKKIIPFIDQLKEKVISHQDSKSEMLTAFKPLQP